MKIPAPKTKFQTNINDRNSKLKTGVIMAENRFGDRYVSVLEFRIWTLFGIWRLVFGILFSQHGVVTKSALWMRYFNIT